MTTHDLDLFYDSLQDQPAVVLKGHLKKDQMISPSVILKIHALMRGAFRKAVAWKYITANPAENVTLREIPVIGRVAAGTPILAEENVEETLTLPEDIVGHGDVFILRVRGESMIQAGIMNDDYIVVHKQPDANNGEIVVALIEDEATVKRFYKENGHIRLQPENDTMEPIIVPTVMILGKVVSLIRKF